MAELIADPTVDNQNTTVKFDVPNTPGVGDYYAYQAPGGSGTQTVTASAVDPQASTKHIRCEAESGASSVTIRVWNPDIAFQSAGGVKPTALATAGEDYVFSFYVKKAVDGGGNGAGWIVSFYDASWSLLQSNFNLSAISMTTSYQQVVATTQTAPSGAAYILCNAFANNALDNISIVHFDTFSLEGPEPPVATLYITNRGFRFPYMRWQ